MARDEEDVAKAKGRAVRMMETSFILMMVLLKTGTNEGAAACEST